MVEIKIATTLLTYRIEEDGTKEDLTTYIKELLKRKEDYVNTYCLESTIIPYNVLKNSVIEIYTIKNN